MRVVTQRGGAELLDPITAARLLSRRGNPAPASLRVEVGAFVFLMVMYAANQARRTISRGCGIQTPIQDRTMASNPQQSTINAATVPMVP